MDFGGLYRPKRRTRTAAKSSGESAVSGPICGYSSTAGGVAERLMAPVLKTGADRYDSPTIPRGIRSFSNIAPGVLAFCWACVNRRSARGRKTPGIALINIWYSAGKRVQPCRERRFAALTSQNRIL